MSGHTKLHLVKTVKYKPQEQLLGLRNICNHFIWKQKSQRQIWWEYASVRFWEAYSEPVSYFCETLHLRCLVEFWIHLRFLLHISESSRREVLWKIAFRKNLSKFSSLQEHSGVGFLVNVQSSTNNSFQNNFLKINVLLVPVASYFWHLPPQVRP